MTAAGFLKLIFLNSVQISWIYHFPLVLPKVCNGFICRKAIVIQSREVIPFRLIGISKGRCPSTWASRQDGRIRSVLLLIINKLIIRRFDGSCLDLSQLRRRMQLFTIGVFKVISLLFNIWLCLMLAGPGLEGGSLFLFCDCFLFGFEWV